MLRILLALPLMLPSHFTLREASLTPAAKPFSHCLMSTLCPSLVIHHVHWNCLVSKCVNLFIANLTQLVGKSHDFRAVPDCLLNSWYLAQYLTKWVSDRTANYRSMSSEMEHLYLEYKETSSLLQLSQQYSSSSCQLLQGSCSKYTVVILIMPICGIFLTLYFSHPLWDPDLVDRLCSCWRTRLCCLMQEVWPHPPKHMWANVFFTVSLTTISKKTFFIIKHIIGCALWHLC